MRYILPLLPREPVDPETTMMKSLPSAPRGGAGEVELEPGSIVRVPADWTAEDEREYTEYVRQFYAVVAGAVPRPLIDVGPL